MSASTPKSLPRRGVAALDAFLNQICQSEEWPLLDPLPVTRELGKKYGISNVSAFRVLTRLRNTGLVWQAANGRFYRAAARRLIEKPLPVACLLRRLEGWTEVSRQMLQGADEACGANDRAILLVHDRVLFNQLTPTSPTTSGSHNVLRESLEDFLLLHGERTSGILLDELWPDEVLANFQGRLGRAIVLYRRTRLPFLGSVSADTMPAARMVLNLAAKRGDREIMIVSPLSDYPPANEMNMALKKAAKLERMPIQHQTFSAEMQDQLAQLIRNKRSKILIAVTEDNAAVSVLAMLKEAGWKSPQSVGLISTMGTRIALDAGITATQFDFQEMGRKAALIAMQENPSHFKIRAKLALGNTTQPS